MKHLTKLLFISSLLALGGCQSIYDVPTTIEPQVAISHNDPQWQQHLAQLKQIKSYTMQGQFGYLSAEERFSSPFDWQYNNPQSFSLTMSSNLSSKSLKLQRNMLGMTVSDSEGNKRTETDINRLMKEMIGVAFPIDHFTYWVKGLPEQTTNYVVNEKRQLSQFSYEINGVVWQVNFVAYHEDRQPNLPKLIVLENGKQTLKIRVDHWGY